jgi:hypothetical protein
MNLLRRLSKLSKAQVSALVRASRWVSVRDALASEIRGLERRLAKARRRLARVERRISGAPAAKRRAAGRRGPRRSGPRLHELLVSILKKLGRSASPSELASLALKAGYDTTSTPEVFSRAVHQVLVTHRELFAKVGPGQYKAKR